MNKGLVYADNGLTIGYCNGKVAVIEIDRATANHIIITNHYSKTVARTSYVHLGVYQDGDMVGVLQFGYMMNPTLRSKVVQGTGKDQYLEFNRMWVTDNAIKNCESMAVSCALRFIKHRYPQVKWVQSYADERCKHFGIVYQACSFTYLGEHKSTFYELDGELYHNILMKVKKGSKLYCKRAKHLQENKSRVTRKIYRQFHYIKFLDKSWNERCLPKAKPYPKYYKENMKPRKTKLFRGLRTENGQWFFGQKILVGENEYALSNGKFIAKVEQSSLGEYIGVVDKHGKDIYEGDRVLFVLHHHGSQSTHSGRVMRSKDYKHFVIINDDGEQSTIYDFDFDSESIEVIGNIINNKANEEYTE